MKALPGIAALALGYLLIVWLAFSDGQQSDQRRLCAAAVSMALKENIPGEGWEVVILIPGTQRSQGVCSNPKIDREKKLVICHTQVMGAWYVEPPIPAQREVSYAR